MRLQPLLTVIAALSLASEGVAQSNPTLPADPRTGRWIVEVEAGPAWQSYNDVEIPNDGSATRFSLYDLAGAGPWPAGRLYVTWNMNPRHGMRLLLAPLTIRESGIPGGEITFAGKAFQPGLRTDARYTFNSYRLTYRYRWHTGDRTTAWIGFTGKVRDAVIALEQDGVASEKTDLGFVPLLHLSGAWRLAPRWALSLDVDALAGGPGRAEDVAIELGLDLNEALTLQAGYRLVEGGADVEEVYTFAWLHYAVLSLIWRPK